MMAAEAGKSRGYMVPLAIKTVSLIAIYALYGLLQERIIKGHYKIGDQDGEGEASQDTFSSPPLLVLCNRLVSLITGFVLTQFQPSASYLPISTPTSPLAQSPSEKISVAVARLKPASPLFYYGLIAALNNAATLSQYASLSHLSFTTSTLGKSSKMVPVLIIGHLWYGKKYKPRQWIGAAVVILGIWGYLISLLNTDLSKDEKTKNTATSWIGVLYLFSYLLFDGMTSTVQERLFGREKGVEESTTLAGITGGIIDQMIWVNLFSSIIAAGLLFISPSSSSISSIKLALSSPTLQLHIFLLSATATAGLLILFHVIATYGALVASLVMTVRQFVSILCNAAWFGNMTSIPLLGWAGIGFVAVGIWIKMDRRFDGPATPVTEKPSSEST